MMKEKIKLTFFNHLGLKAMALAIAFLSWLIIVNVSNYTITKTISGIEVKQVNGEAITKNGKVYAVVDGDTVDIVVKGPRQIVENLSDDNFTATADLSKLSITNSTNIEVKAKDDDINRQVTIVSNNSMMTLSIEDQKEKEFPVTIITTGNVKAGYAPGKPVSTPNIVTVKGPESVLNQITGIRAVVDVSDRSENFETYAEIAALDADSNKITQNNLVFSDNSVLVKVPINTIKTIPINVSTIGRVKDGFGVKEISYNPKEIEISADPDTLAKTESIEINDVDVTDASLKVEKNYSLESYLPEGATLVSDAKEVAVSVLVEKYAEKSILVTSSDITFRNSDLNNYNYEITGAMPSVVVKGFSENMESLNASMLKASVDVDGLTEGTYTKTLELPESNNYQISQTYRVNVKVTNKN